MNGTTARRIAAVERYIHDLAIALAGIPVDEREDVIAGVRDHIEDALAGIDDPGPDDVERILTSLGDPAEIAADARSRSGESTAQSSSLPNDRPEGSRESDSTTSEATSRAATSLLTRKWVPVVTMGAFVLVGFRTLAEGSMPPLMVVLWLGALVVLIASPLWSAAERLVGAMWLGVLPLVAGLVASVVLGAALGIRSFGLADLGYVARDRIEFDVVSRFVVAGGFAVGLLATSAIMAWLIVTGTRRAQRLTP